MTRSIKNYAARGESVQGEIVTASDGKISQDALQDDLPEVVVLASGNLGLVYGTQTPGRKTIEQIESFFPGLLDGLAAREGVGFVMVGSEKAGPVVIGQNGRRYLKDGRVEGEDPLDYFGPRAAQHLLREDGFANCPDVLVNSFYDVESNEVAAFEELIGCHGGLGGFQTQPFLLYPAEWRLDTEKKIVGAAAVYKQLKLWLAAVN